MKNLSFENPNTQFRVGMSVLVTSTVLVIGTSDIKFNPLKIILLGVAATAFIVAINGHNRVLRVAVAKAVEA